MKSFGRNCKIADGECSDRLACSRATRCIIECKWLISDQHCQVNSQNNLTKMLLLVLAVWYPLVRWCSTEVILIVYMLNASHWQLRKLLSLTAWQIGDPSDVQLINKDGRLLRASLFHLVVHFLFRICREKFPLFLSWIHLKGQNRLKGTD